MKTKHNIGFTLVEVLVSTAITSILIVALTMALSTASNNWQKTTAVHDSFREARIALKMIKNDLKNLYRQPITNADGLEISPIYIRGGASSNMPFLPDAGGGNTSTGLNSGNMAFFATMPVEAQPDPITASGTNVGDIGIIGYYVYLASETVGGTTRYVQKLYRYVRGSADTMTLINALRTDTAQPIFSGYPLFNQSANYNPRPFQTSGGATGTIQDSPVAINVVRFDIKPRYISNPSGSNGDQYATVERGTNDYKSTNKNDSYAEAAFWGSGGTQEEGGGTYEVGTYDSNAGDGWPNATDNSANRYIPESIDIVLQVVNDDIANRLSAFTKNVAASNWNGQTYLYNTGGEANQVHTFVIKINFK